MRKIVYQHIPKTGGQTLATRLASAFPLGRSSIMGADLHYPQGVSALHDLLARYDFVERHINGPVLAELRDVDILVTVRDPVKQIVSNYLHIAREPASPLHRPVKILPPERFFREYGDLLANHQTRYFIVGHRDLHPDLDRLVNWLKVMLECLERVRWFVPTEAIDEFCMLWQIETSQRMFLADMSMNVAEAAGEQRLALENIVRNMPELYGIDLLLWQIARQRYSEYRRAVLDRAYGNACSNNWGRVWSAGELGIWLGRGWHPPQETPFGLTYWAGPDRLSEMRFKRDDQYCYLCFSLIVFCGVYEENVIFVSPQGVNVPARFSRINEQEVIYVVDLKQLPYEGLLMVKVPEVWSPAMVSLESNNTRRQSVAACRWKLVEHPPVLESACCSDHVFDVRNLHAGDSHGVYLNPCSLHPKPNTTR